MKPIIFCDFDGTITLQDTTDAILETFADPAWIEVEKRWVAGEIGSRECLREQMTLVSADEEELGKLVDAIPIDPHFAEFAQSCVDRGYPFHIVSDGFDWVILRTLARPELHWNGLLKNFQIAASSLKVSERYMIITFPHSSMNCTHGCATCKPRLMDSESKGYSPVVFIGDGYSDRHAVSAADIVFARKSKSLEEYCVSQNIAHIPFEDFAEVQRELFQTLAARAAQMPASWNPHTLSLKAES
jgi:2-hydroxy-3-keto-5-methylthiopentenyl-1-phosphate phosphatase